MTWTLLLRRSLRYIVGLVIGGIVIGALVAAQGENLSIFINVILKSSFGSTDAILNLARWTAPLILSSLAFVIGARAGIFNTGVEGQIIVGACAAAIIGSSLRLPAIILLPLATVVGAVAGLLWAWPAAWLFRRYRINEVVTTLMLNYIAVLLCDLIVRVFFLARSAGGHESITVTSRPISNTAVYPSFVSSSSASWTVVLTIVIFIAGAIVLLSTRWGDEITAIGGSRQYASYAGIDARGVQFRVFLLSGAIGGLVGAFEVQGILHQFIDGSLTNFGWNGILGGLLALNNPVGIGGSSLFLGVIQNSQLAIQQFTNVSPYMVQLIAPLFILVFAIDPVKKIIQTIRRRSDT
ncbi:MAG: ABC transporter permease [Microbacteriaceae bacterium]|nr:MAG: ABC transporter permease [Microbacteriaceae bacterium]